MATKIYYFSGKANWAKLQKPDEKYNTYTLDLYMDENEIARYTASGAQSEVRTDEKTGERYVRFRRPHSKLVKNDLKVLGPPDVFIQTDDGNDEPFTDLVGNGSMVVAKVAIYDTVKGKGATLEGVRVTDLVEYKKIERDISDDIAPF